MQHPIVVIRQPGHAPIFLSLRGPVEIGRECGGLLLSDPQASRRHAELSVSDGAVLVTDLGSTNGTTVDGRSADMPMVLTSGATAVVGQTTIELVVDAPEKAAVLARPTSPPGATSTMVGSGPDPSALRQTSIDLVADAVAAERHDLNTLGGDQGTITIVFSDIESSTERALALGDVGWLEVLEVHNEIIRGQVNRYGGREIKSQGDGFMLSFPGARRALQCMIEVQRELHDYDRANPGKGVRIRIGCHTGEALVDDDGDIYGKHVIMAARVANLALGGEILVSALVKEIVSARGDMDFGQSRAVELKGIEGDHVVYPLVWEQI